MHRNLGTGELGEYRIALSIPSTFMSERLKQHVVWGEFTFPPTLRLACSFAYHSKVETTGSGSVRLSLILPVFCCDKAREWAGGSVKLLSHSLSNIAHTYNSATTPTPIWQWEINQKRGRSGYFTARELASSRRFYLSLKSSHHFGSIGACSLRLISTDRLMKEKWTDQASFTFLLAP